ncbi:MAG TPA: DNA polymerase I [Clostridiaceae bacterium]|jgi:DNA polymerase-1|nr:DNA polymerase I [Clostridiaceae bacterium]
MKQMMSFGTLSRYGEKKNLEVTILSGDRDTFQLATDKVTIRIPHTKGGKTETDLYNKEKIIEKYGIEPQQLIDVKGLQGDTSDNIPGVPGVGEKTALSLIQRYGSIENLYKKIENGEDDLKGKQREKIVNNKELAFMSKTLGTINLQVPISDTLEDFKVEEWNKEKVLEIFKELNFKRYIDRFNLLENNKGTENQEKELFKSVNKKEEEIIQLIKEEQEIIFYFETKKNDLEENIIKEEIVGINIYNQKQNEVYNLNLNNNKILNFKEILEDEKIKKISIDLTKIYILLKQVGINIEGMHYDIAIASYILNPTNNKLNIDNLIEQYLNIDINEYTKSEDSGKQINLFDNMEKEDINQEEKEKYMMYAYSIGKIKNITSEKLKEVNSLDLFYNIDMPTVEVLSDMQWNGMYVDKEELEQFGKELTSKLETITKIIYEMAGEEFNINSTKQLGEILFEKMKLPVIKKTKSGYSTDVDVLEKLKKEDPIIEQILEYRQLMKLNSTYVEGLKPYINIKTNRIHSFFHQTITATGRISSTEPNLQNIPTRFELGKRVRKVFKPEKGKIYLDADYSQIELRVLASISGDEHMIEAFKEGKDIHKQAASKVFKTPIEEVTKEQRSNAKAVNFGIVYGISDFGLGEQLGIGRKKAKQYIEEYLEQYAGIKQFMENITEQAKEQGYVETLFHRRRYIPELKSNNYMVRQFGARAAMNTPIQGTAADIMKIAMIKVYNEIKSRKLKSKIILQVHDEMMVETPIEEKEEMIKIMKKCMESAANLEVPLIAEISDAENWYECK